MAFINFSCGNKKSFNIEEIKYYTKSTSNINQSFNWKGRRLIEHSIGGTTYTYTYNDQGIRTSRSDGTQTTTYFLDGSLVLFEKTGNDVIYYTYDADGSILSLNYLGDEYFYIKNLQGDIIEIVDASGTSVAKYRYDAWGNIIYQWDSGLGIANANPYRYRSYRLDSGTGLYYLNARYYDPSIGRFISADSINYLDPSSGQGLNLYAYCGNNPVMYVDISGEFPILITLIVTGLIVGGGSQYLANSLNGKVGSDRWEGVIGASVGGAIALPAFLYTGGTVYTLALTSGIVNGIINEIERSIRYETNFSIGSAAYDATIYSILNMIPFVRTVVGATIESFIIDTAGFYYADKYKDDFFSLKQQFFKDVKSEVRSLALEVYESFMRNVVTTFDNIILPIFP